MDMNRTVHRLSELNGRAGTAEILANHLLSYEKPMSDLDQVCMPAEAPDTMRTHHSAQ